jgi:hypothetical protein
MAANPNPDPSGNPNNGTNPPKKPVVKRTAKLCWLWNNVKCSEMEIDGRRPCNKCDWHSLYVNQDSMDYMTYEQAIKKKAATNES